MYSVMLFVFKKYLLVCRIFGYIFFPIVSLFIATLFIGWLFTFRDSVLLPNGITIQREFDFSVYGTDALYAPDNKTRIVRGIEFICFNDRFIKVRAYGNGGTFDAERGIWLREDPTLKGKEYDKISQLHTVYGSCNGYFTGYLDPAYFYDQNKWPNLPPCAWRNFDNPNLKNKEWLKRPCESSYNPPF